MRIKKDDYAYLKPLNLTPYQERTIKRETERIAKGRQDYAVQMTMAMFVSVLCDKFGGEDWIPEIIGHVRKLCVEAGEGRINLNDLLTTLRKEYDFDFR